MEVLFLRVYENKENLKTEINKAFVKYISEFDNVVVDLENFVERFKDIGKNLNLLSTYYLYDILEAGE